MEVIRRSTPPDLELLLDKQLLPYSSMLPIVQRQPDTSQASHASINAVADCKRTNASNEHRADVAGGLRRMGRRGACA